MLNNFCLHVYAQKLLLIAENCNAFFLTASASTGVLPVYPAELTVSSDGPAGTAQSSNLGVFLKEDSQLCNNRPVYQLDRGGQYLYYDDSGYWLIGPTAGGSNGGIATVLQGLLAPVSYTHLTLPTNREV